MPKTAKEVAKLTSPVAFMIYRYMIDESKEGEAKVYMKEICTELCISDQTATKAVRSLIRNKLIKRSEDFYSKYIILE